MQEKCVKESKNEYKLFVSLLAARCKNAPINCKISKRTYKITLFINF